MAAALLLLSLAAASGARLGDLARKDAGDVFTLMGEECGPAQCVEHGAGAAEAVAGAGAGVGAGVGAGAGDAGGQCACACPQRAPLFREDRELCVDDLPECSLATFGTGVGVQRIPFVYLPLKGQIIHPSREITFQNVKTPICAVSGAQFLTRKGFLDLRNTLDADVPFSLFRDEGRTFLQWSGEDEVRARMTGRVMVVRLLCRDVAAAPTSPLDLRGVFTPCVAFRVQGTPPRHSSNVTEVQFAPNAQTSEATSTSGLTVTEYVAIGISSLLLGLIYVASVFLYLHIRKRRKAASEEGSERRLKGLKKKDGTAITERDIIRINNERVQSLPNALGQDDGVVKKNPLLNLGRQFHDSKSSFPSDSGSNMSDSEDFADSSVRSEEMRKSFNGQTTSAIVHLHHGDLKLQNESSELNHRDESGIERLPHEHVSIVETTDDREIARPVGTTRRKLYFNPAYFEPHLMAEPPPAALEFLSKIREVISIAKHKMAAKRFHPVLNQIPEEETYPSTRNSIDLYQGLGSQRSGSVVSLKRENSRKRSCVGCPGCKSDSSDIQNFMKYDVPACSNCLSNKGDKQNSIRKWLENIPTGKQQSFYNDFMPSSNQNGMVSSLQSLPTNDSKFHSKNQNSFKTNSSTYLENSIPKKSSTISVRSEPPLRNYNLPLPEFENMNYQPNSFGAYCQTVSRVDDIRPIGLSDYRSGSLRSNSAANQRRHKFIHNKNLLPDMVNEAIALDHGSKSYNQNSSDEERFLNNVPKSAALNFLRNVSESPCNDYETDSLERNSHKKGKSTPTDYPEVPSSQASPSLSNALPLEEELTMRNAVYKHSSSNSNTPSPQREIFVDQSHYESSKQNGDTLKPKTFENNKLSNKNADYSLVTEVYVNNNYNFGSTPTSPSSSECSIGSRKLGNTNVKSENTSSTIEEKPGCLTIELKDPPENYIKIHESDGFEPDTLDRKHPKHKALVESIQFSRKDLIKSLNNSESPPAPNQRIQLRSSGTFGRSTEKVEYASKFNSLRNEYESGKASFERPKLSSATFNDSKTVNDVVDDNWEEVEEWQTEEGRILTLELRHSKRQRQSTPPTINQMKSLARPDVLPPLPPTEESPVYEQPAYPPRRVEDDRLPTDIQSKNLNGRSLSPRMFMKNMIEQNIRRNSLPHETYSGPSCSPSSASVIIQSSGYENVESMSLQDLTKSTEICRSTKRRPSTRSACGGEINTNTFVKAPKSDSRPRFRRKKGSTVEDSGYLSSDSACSRQFSRKIVVAKIVSCSESDDTENEARSESGAESVETHSVYFGSFRKLQRERAGAVNVKSVKDNNRKQKLNKDCL